MISGAAIYNRTAYAGAVASLAAAGQYAHAQLWNPANSGRKAFLYAFTCGAAVGGRSVQVGLGGALIGNLITSPYALLANGMASPLHLRDGVPAAPQPQSVMFNVYMDGTSIFIPLAQPIIVLPGYGCNVRSAAAATSLYASFAFYEEAA